MKKNKILITGGAGYIGSRLVNAFIKKGYKVVVIDNFSSGKNQNINSKAKYYKVDILSDEIFLIIKKERPEIIFHLASLKSVEESFSHPELFRKVNVDGSKNVLEAARKLGIKKFVFTSTAAVYGEDFTDGFQKESQKPNPLNPYGETKLEIEKIIGEFNKKYGMEGIVLRFANVYGPGGDTEHEGVVNIFVEQALQNKPITVFGDGDQTRDFIFTDDIVDMCLLLVKTNYKQKIKDNFIFNLATGREVSISNILAILKTSIKRMPKAIYDLKVSSGQKKSILSPDLTKKILDWKSKTNLEKGIRETVNFYEKNISKSKIVKVTIGIPAFNEEQNIGFLLKEILSQRQEKFIVEKIIISSDGSSDDTKKIVKGFKSKKIHFIDNKDRKGQSVRQNQIIEMTKSDILILINADILIPDKDFIKKLIKPIIDGTADLVSSKLLGIKPRTFVERVLVTSLLYKNSLYETINGGANVYTCHGAARAFSKKLYNVFQFDQSIAEDAYSFLYALKNKFSYNYTPEAVAYYKLPETISDHKKQSVRFLKSQKYLSRYFDKDFIKANYSLPKVLVFLNFIKYLALFPIEMVTFSFILILMKINTLFNTKLINTWDVATSSKGGRI